MKIAYIFPAFPVPTEAFAVSDLNALADLTDEVHVFSLRGLNANRRRHLRATTLRPNIRTDFGSFRQSAMTCIRHPFVVLWLIAMALRTLSKNPALAASIVLATPRVVAIVHSLADLEADVVHAFWGRHPSLVLGVLKRFWPDRHRRSIFVGAYDLVSDDELVRLGLLSADVHFTHTRANRDYFRQRGIGDVHVVWRGIPVRELHHSESFERNTVITASALDPRKRVDLVIDSVDKLVKNGREVDLVIAGDGPDRGRLTRLVREKGIEERVRFLGHVSRTELSRLMADRQVFLFLSEKPSERLPNVVKEALFAGCYVMVSDTPGIEELVCSAFGRILQTRDPAEIAEAMGQAFDEPARHAQRRRKAAGRWMSSRWSSDAAMARYLDVWRSE